MSTRELTQVIEGITYSIMLRASDQYHCLFLSSRVDAVEHASNGNRGQRPLVLSISPSTCLHVHKSLTLSKHLFPL